MPTNQAQYIGDTEGVKFWNWSNGALITYNSQEGSNANELSGALGFYAIKELIKTGNSEKIDGYTVYKLDGSELSDSVKTNENGDLIIKFFYLFIEIVFKVTSYLILKAIIIYNHKAFINNYFYSAMSIFGSWASEAAMSASVGTTSFIVPLLNCS